MAMAAGVDEVQMRAAARVGQILRGKWRLDALLGVGGSACVYAATHRNGKRGAVKLLHPELSANQEARHRFLREGYVANRIEHPGAVGIIDDDVAEDGSVFLVMELLEGQTLEEYACSRPYRRLSSSEAAVIVDKLLDLLVAAHDKGIIHRDLKPENVFLTHTGEVKVLDFGIARLREGPSTGRMTEAGHIMGTPTFMPPEQALGNSAEIDGRTDLWAVGAILFYVLTGQVVHSGATVNQILLSAMTRQAPPLGSIAPDIPPELCAIVDRSLAFQKDKRWPNARAMQQALRAVRQTLPATGSMPVPTATGVHTQSRGAMTGNLALTQDASSAPARAGWRVALVMGGLLVVAVLAAVIVFVSTKPAPPSTAAAIAPVPPKETASALPVPPPQAAPSGEASAAASGAPVAQTSTPRQTSPVSAPKTNSTTKPATKTKPSGGTKDIFSQW